MTRLLDPRVAGLAPFGALLLALVGGAALLDGDQRAGWFPWATAGACLLLAICCGGIVQAHEPTAPTRVLLGGWGSAFAFIAIATAFIAMGLGEGADVPPAVATMPMLLAGSGIVTLPIANGMLARATGRAGRLPRWGVVSLWAVTPLLPVTLLAGAAAEGAAESMVPLIGLGLLGIGWVTIGLALRAVDE